MLVSKQNIQKLHLDYVLKVVQHIKNTLGEIYSTISFDMQNGKPMTVIIVSPTIDRNYYLLVTVTADCSLTEHKPAEQNMEFTFGMPLSWEAPINEDAMELLSSEDKLPLLLMLLLAEYSYIHNADVSCGDTIPNSDMFNNFSYLLLHFPFLGSDFELLTTDAECIMFLGVYPITENEFEFKQSKDSDSLIRQLYNYDVSLCFDKHRNSVVI